MKKTLGLLLVVVLLAACAVAEGWISCSECGWDHAAGVCPNIGSTQVDEEPEDDNEWWKTDDPKTEDDDEWWKTDESEPEEDEWWTTNESKEDEVENLGEYLYDRSQNCNHEWEVFSDVVRVENGMKVYGNQWFCGKCNLHGNYWETTESKTETAKTVTYAPASVEENKENNMWSWGVILTIAAFIVGLLIICKIYKAYKKFARNERRRNRREVVYDDVLEVDEDECDEYDDDEYDDEEDEEEVLNPDEVH